MKWMKSSLRTALLLAAIIIVATFLRLYKLSVFPPGLYPDEAVNGNNAIEALATGEFRMFYPENNGREGLFINLQAFSIAAFGNTPFSLRLVSAILGIVTVAGMYFLGKELLGGAGGRGIGLLASLFMAVNFWHVNFSRIGFRAISAPFFLVFGFYFYCKAFNQFKRKARIANFYYLMSGVFFGLGFYTYIAYRFLPFLLAAALFIFWKLIEPQRKTQFLLGIGIWSLVMLVIAFPLGLYFMAHPGDFWGRALEVSVFNAGWTDILSNIGKTLAMFTFIGDWNWRHNYSGWPLLSPLIGIPFFAGITIAGTRAVRTRCRDLASSIPILWLFIMLGANFLSPEGSPHALRALVAAPAVFLLAAIGAEWLWQRLSGRWRTGMRLAAGAVFVGALLVAGWYEYFIRWAPHPETANAFSANYVAQAKVLAELPPELPKYIIANGGGVDVRGFPASAQTLIYLLGGWDERAWKIPNVRIVRERAWDRLAIAHPALIMLMQDTPEWRQRIYGKRFAAIEEMPYGTITVFRIVP